MADARYTALKILKRVRTDSAYSNLELFSALDESGLDSRDRGLCSALVNGVLERRITLDYIISAHSSIKLKAITPLVLDILRMGVYQLGYMDRIPESAAVNEAVKLTKKVGSSRAGGFVNAVLRGVLRDTSAFSLPDGDSSQDFAVRYSVLPTVAELLVESYGIETIRDFLEASFGRPPLDIRVNTLKISPVDLQKSFDGKNIAMKTDDRLDGFSELNYQGSPDKLEEFRQGLFHVQDRASQLCCLALGARPGESVLDICAAPGGKSFTIAQMMGDSGRVVSCDIHEHRVALIRSGIKRLGLGCVTARVNDATVGNPLLGEFDRVLCDVPCSGYGVIRRKPDIRYKNPSELSDLYRLQAQIFEASSKRVRRGGILLYSTCTLNPDENERAVQSFLDNHRDFSPLPLFEGGNECMKTFFTHIDQTDGFFTAKLIRNE